MNKKISAFFEEKNFVIEKNSAFGKIGNYEASVRVEMLNNVAPVQIQLNFYATAETKRNIVNQLRELKLKFFTWEANLYGIFLGFNGITVASLMKNLDDMLNKIVAIIDANEVLGLGYCPVCGNQLIDENKQYQVEWIKISLDAQCVSNLNAVIAGENEEFDNAPNNYVKGTIGAIIGAVVGAIVSIVLLEIGFIAAISAFVAVWLGAILYKKFGGKPNKGMIVIVTIVSLVSQLLTMYLIYLGVAIVLAPEFGFGTVGMDAFKDMMTVKEFKTEFVANMAMTLFFTLLGVGSYVGKLVQETKRQKSIK